MLDQKKIYVLDTNVLVEDPEAIFKFEQATIGIPIQVLEELDMIKKEPSSRGANARMIVRHLDQVRDRGSLKDEVVLENGTRLRVLFEYSSNIHHLLGEHVADNKILANAMLLKERGYEVVFVSKDINARVKADVLGLTAQDYLRGVILTDNYYKGWQEHDIAGIELKKDKPDILQDLVQADAVECNEFVVLYSKGNQHNYKMFRYHGGGLFTPVVSPLVKWPIAAKNIHQIMALDLMFDDNIKMVSLTGPAGTGKTFLTLLAGLYQVLVKNSYQKMMVARSVVPLGHDIGFLPGDVQEKLHGWMQPIYDNVDFITHLISSMHQFDITGGFDDEDDFDHRNGGQRRRRSKRKEFGKNKFHRQHEWAQREFRSLDDLVAQRKMSLEAITYMRGRSIPNQFILIDEVQNLTTHEVKTILSRVGENTKIILAGDPYQIDVAYLDFSTNGLMVASDKFKGQSLFGSVYMPISERSELSRLVQELL